jgi:hypothetical protein
VPNAEETEIPVEFDWLAESLAGLCGLNRSRRKIFMLSPFFFFAVVDEGWLAMKMRVTGRRE